MIRIFIYVLHPPTGVTGQRSLAINRNTSVGSVANHQVNRTGVSGHFTSFESESERHVIFASCEQLSARVA